MTAVKAGGELAREMLEYSPHCLALPSLTESEKGLIQKVAGEVLPESVTG